MINTKRRILLILKKISKTVNKRREKERKKDRDYLMALIRREV